jgi:hypothetical protein
MRRYLPQVHDRLAQLRPEDGPELHIKANRVDRSVVGQKLDQLSAVSCHHASRFCGSRIGNHDRVILIQVPRSFDVGGDHPFIRR